MNTGYAIPVIPEWVVTRPTDEAAQGGPPVATRVEVIAPLLEWDRRQPTLHGATIKTDMQANFDWRLPTWMMRIHWQDAPLRMIVTWDEWDIYGPVRDPRVYDMYARRAHLTLFETDDYGLYGRGRTDWQDCGVRDFDRLTAIIAAHIADGYDWGRLAAAVRAAITPRIPAPPKDTAP